MSGYRDDEEAQRMRVASLEERLAELEAENEALRELEAEVESPLAFGPHRNAPPPVPQPSKDVEETLATLRAMGADVARREAEVSNSPVWLSISPVTPTAQASLPSVPSALVGPTEAPLARVEDLGRDRENEARMAVEAAYWTGMRHGMFMAVLALIALGVFVALLATAQ